MQIINWFVEGYTGYASYLWQEITMSYGYKPWYQNYFYWLILISVFFFLMEWIAPWRVEQPKFRRDFWLDSFYMFFNFFLFSLLIYNAASNVVVNSLGAILSNVFGIKNLVAIELQQFPYWLILVIGFVVRDFVQWNTHRLLHRTPVLWEFHKVHHSVKQMGFAAHLRYHWMETVVYRSVEYLPLALLGIGLYDFFIIHIFTIAVGHFNHANWQPSSQQKGAIFGAVIGCFVGMVGLETAYWWAFCVLGAGIGVAVHPIWGYIFNSPDMHIWHHAKYIPFPDGSINGAFDSPTSPYRNGINFGISLSLWDYIFGTAYIPHDGRDIVLGFDNDEVFPSGFLEQEMYPFKK